MCSRQLTYAIAVDTTAANSATHFALKIICAAIAERIAAVGHTIAIGIVVTGIAVAISVMRTIGFTINCFHRGFRPIVPFASNTLSAKPGSSSSFPFFSYGYQNIAYYGTP